MSIKLCWMGICRGNNVEVVEVGEKKMYYSYYNGITVYVLIVPLLVLSLCHCSPSFPSFLRPLEMDGSLWNEGY